jgi:hypothetical protein
MSISFVPILRRASSSCFARFSGLLFVNRMVSISSLDSVCNAAWAPVFGVKAQAPSLGCLWLAKNGLASLPAITTSSVLLAAVPS